MSILLIEHAEVDLDTMASVSEQLHQLAALLDKELITRAQFEEQRDQLLAESRARVSTPPAAGSSPRSTDGSDLTGQRIGEYLLQRKLGEGGMGAVYLGAHETLDQRVAVKVLDAALARNTEVRTRFIQEANIQVYLQHPGIVRVLTAHTQGEYLALVMEHVEGLSLEQALERHGRLPLDRTMHLFGQVLDAVAYAHTRGVVHRDLKPSNIMVQPDGTAKVMDFGIAKVLGASKLTRTGTLMGTAQYMSPEQVLGRSDIDHRTDIYSLGVTFFEALTGQVPFEGRADENTDSDFLIRQAHVGSAPPDPRSICSDIPGPIAQALLRALEKKPGRRFQSCGEFAGAATGLEEPGCTAAPDEESLRPEVAAHKPPSTWKVIGTLLGLPFGQIEDFFSEAPAVAEKGAKMGVLTATEDELAAYEAALVDADSSWAGFGATESQPFGCGSVRGSVIGLAVWIDGVPKEKVEISDESITIGRKGGAAGLQVDDETMTDLHCAVQRAEDGSCYMLLDFGSESGTLLNGERVNNALLGTGDVIECGNSRLVVTRIEEL